MSGIAVGVGPRGTLAFEQITVSTTPIGITSTKLRTYSGGMRNQAIGAFFSTETGDIRVTFDGTTPSATVGHLYPAGSMFELWGFANLTKFRMYAVTVDATVTVTVWSE